MTGIRIMQKLFEDLVSESLPKLAAHLEELGLPLSIVTTNWYVSMSTVPLAP